MCYYILSYKSELRCQSVAMEFVYLVGLFVS